MKTLMLTLMLGFMASIGSAQEPLRSGTIELSMMDKCIDDIFSKCIEEMEEQVQNVYFPAEIKDEDFQQAWDNEDCAQQKLQRLQRKYSELTINHTRAICVYTEETPNIYQPLNTVLRTGAATYGTPDFKYHALYFWLTTALQILGANSCQTTYRKTSNDYNGHIGQFIRFGQFTSSSRKPNLNHFGNKTCFHIETCLGAYIDDYSVIEGEEEVLIPSYEKFRISNIVTNSYKELKCEKIFVLERVGHSSKLDCKAVNHNLENKANSPLILGFPVLIGMVLISF